MAYSVSAICSVTRRAKTRKGVWGRQCVVPSPRLPGMASRLVYSCKKRHPPNKQPPYTETDHPPGNLYHTRHGKLSRSKVNTTAASSRASVPCPGRLCVTHAGSVQTRNSNLPAYRPCRTGHSTYMAPSVVRVSLPGRYLHAHVHARARPLLCRHL
jgi:hypothetical protein